MIDSPSYSIIAAEFNKPLIDAMVEVVCTAFDSHNLSLSKVLRVPGSYELPIIADYELAKSDVAGLVVLGYIEKGETLHGEVMGHVVHRSLVELQLQYKKPIGIGIIGPGATPEQAQVRHLNCAKAAVNALIRVTHILKDSQ